MIRPPVWVDGAVFAPLVVLVVRHVVRPSELILARNPGPDAVVRPLLIPGGSVIIIICTRRAGKLYEARPRLAGWLAGTSSAVSKPNFASKFSLESSRRDLHNALLCTVL